MSRIKQIVAEQVTDSRGNPTVSARVFLESGKWGEAAVPSGASTGTREAIELRDGDRKVYRGKSVYRAVENINKTLNLALRRMPVVEQRAIDNVMLTLDGSDFKKNLGANALLAVSLAVADAASRETLGDDMLFDYIAKLHGSKYGSTLPVPMMNVINGGEHASNLIRLQEFMIMPVGARSIWESLCMGSSVFAELRNLVTEIPDNPAVGVGDEGGFAPMLCPGQPQEKKVRAGLDLILRAIENAKLKPGSDVVLAIDAAASEFYDPEKKLYRFSYESEPPQEYLTSDQMIDFYASLISEYPILSIEDGLAEQDVSGWITLTKRLGDKVQLVGDDLFVTNAKIFREGIKNGMGNSILVKVNQIGTLSETLDTIALAEKSGYTSVVSHRSGETLDTKIADIAVGCDTGQIKTGSMSRGDRIAKYNRLKDIELLELGTKARFPAASIFSRFKK